jgi:hypothetical protein
MTRAMRWFMLVGLGALSVPISAAAQAAERTNMHYRLKVRVEPSSHRLEAEAWIQQPPATTFYLHEGLTVREVEADGKAATFTRSESADRLPYVPEGTSVTVDAPGCRELHLKYDGEIRGVIFGCNLLTPELVELAFYTGWYPVFTGLEDFTFALEVDLPTGYLTTTNGSRTGLRESEGRTVTVWESCAPGFDLVLLASPELRQLEGEAGGMRVEVCYSEFPAEFAQNRIAKLSKAVERLTALYGPLRVKGVLRLVYSPRPGQGYMRMPLVVISEERAREDLQDEFGEARRFRDEVHEIAHFWWALADSSTPDDWINEGLAEYSAFRLSEEQYGKAFAAHRLEEYRQHVCGSQTADAIAETEGFSPDREVNRYDKATLMLLEARARFGEDRLDLALKHLFARFDGTHRVTTALFLEAVRTQMGEETEAFFRKSLYRKGTANQPS